MTISERLDRYQRRHRSAAFPIAVLYKYFDDFGWYLAALIAYYSLVSLFPLLLLLSALLGIVLAGHPELQQHVLHSALAQFPVVGDQLGEPRRLGGGPVGLIVGIGGSLYGGLGVGQALQYAMNTAWTVPRNSRPNPIKSRVRSLLLLATAGPAVLGTTILSSLGPHGAGSLGPLLRGLLLAASMAINAAVFVFVFRLAVARKLTVRQVAPGAVAAAVVWQLIQSFGVIYIGHVVRNASPVNSVLALVLGLLAFLYITAGAVVLCAEIDVVHVHRLYPRALLTPFTDDVDLTRGDKRSYTTQTKAQRSKGSQQIAVHFDQPSADAGTAPEEPAEEGKPGNTAADEAGASEPDGARSTEAGEHHS
ncbi:MAG: YihY/virulence factor BrkB family protein [Mycobacteriales bacterium]